MRLSKTCPFYSLQFIAQLDGVLQSADQSTVTSSGEVLLIGGVEYKEKTFLTKNLLVHFQTGRGGWSYLPETLNEINSVKTILKNIQNLHGVTVRKGMKATEVQFEETY